MECGNKGAITHIWISKEPVSEIEINAAWSEGRFYKLPVDEKNMFKVKALTGTIPFNDKSPFIEMLLKKLNEDLQRAMSEGEEYVERENQEAANEEWAKADYIQGLIDTIKKTWNIT